MLSLGTAEEQEAQQNYSEVKYINQPNKYTNQIHTTKYINQPTKPHKDSQNFGRSGGCNNWRLGKQAF